MNRTEQLLQLRSEIQTDSERQPLAHEAFQNTALRPILKLQNDVLVHFFKSQLNGAQLPDFKMELDGFVKQRLQKDMLTRNTLLGMVVGLLTEDELVTFLADKSEMSKRIIDMLSQRLCDQLGKAL